MGKARKTSKKKAGVGNVGGEEKGYVVDDRQALIDTSSRGFIYDEVDDFEEQQNEQGMRLVEETRDKRVRSKEQVLGIDVGSSSDEYDEEVDEDEELNENEDGESEEDEDLLFMENDDIKEEREFKLPDARAWGNKKNRYFGTDASDERILDQLYTQDEEMAKLEEETARELQDRMAAELQDLTPEDLIPQEQLEKKKEKFEKDEVEVDVSGLSTAKKLRLLKRESPEFFPLIEDMKNKCEEVQSFLRPLMKGIKKGYVPEGPTTQYITTKYRLLLNYISNLSVYMMLKSSHKTVSNHPVVGRLAQYRKLLQELEPCDEKLALKLKKLLAAIENGTASKVQKKKQKKPIKTLKLLKAKEEEKVSRVPDLLPEDSEDNNEEEEQPLRAGGGGKRKREAGAKAKLPTKGLPNEENVDDMEPEAKRGLTYQISKNKGLTPYRNKAVQNPRVHYKKKYKKKLKRRTGQVANVRREVNRYDGEMRGIKANTIRSRKINL